MSKPDLSVHRCPGCHKPGVPNAMLACSGCWGALPRVLKQEVRASVRYPLVHLRRREALAAAMKFWRSSGDLPGSAVR